MNDSTKFCQTRDYSEHNAVLSINPKKGIKLRDGIGWLIVFIYAQILTGGWNSPKNANCYELDLPQRILAEGRLTDTLIRFPTIHPHLVWGKRDVWIKYVDYTAIRRLERFLELKTLVLSFDYIHH